MGAELAKVAVPIALQMAPAIIKAIRGDDGNQARNNANDRIILEAFETMRRNRNDIDQIMENQTQLMQALGMLVERLQNGDGNLALENGASGSGNQVLSRSQGPGSIRIEMELPEGTEAREAALLMFWTQIRDKATAFTEQNGQPLLTGTESVRERNLAITASAPPVFDDEPFREPSKHESFLICEICTQRYNTTDRRPTLLSLCGHTFCKECIRKARRRNSLCPNCRQEANVNVDEHPTNYAILDFLTEDDKVSKKDPKQLSIEDVGLSFEEQLEIARQISLESLEEERRLVDQRRLQEEKDMLLARQLEAEEERVQAFRRHEDTFMKSRSVNDEFMSGYHQGGNRGNNHSEERNGTSPRSPEEDQDREISRSLPYRQTYPSDDDDDDLHDICHASLRRSKTSQEGAFHPVKKETYSNGAQYSAPRNFLPDEDDTKKLSDSEVDDEDLKPCGTGYEDARLMLWDEALKEYCKSDDLKSDVKCENSSGLHEEKPSESDGGPSEISSTQPKSLFEAELERMEKLAEETRQQDKKRKVSKKWIREQEDIELAKVLSLSMELT